MNAKRLSRLLNLADRRADRALNRLQSLRHEVGRLLQQRAELVTFNRDYQHATRTASQMLPTLVQCRQSFVGALQGQIEQLDERLYALQLDLRQAAQHYRSLSAQARALAALAERASAAALDRALRSEQRHNDETGLAMRTVGSGRDVSECD